MCSCCPLFEFSRAWLEARAQVKAHQLALDLLRNAHPACIGYAMVKSADAQPALDVSATGTPDDAALQPEAMQYLRATSHASDNEPFQTSDFFLDTSISVDDSAALTEQRSVELALQRSRAGSRNAAIPPQLAECVSPVLWGYSSTRSEDMSRRMLQALIVEEGDDVDAVAYQHQQQVPVQCDVNTGGCVCASLNLLVSISVVLEHVVLFAHVPAQFIRNLLSGYEI